MSADPADLIRAALQARVNAESGEDAGYVVVHYVAVLGLYQVGPDGAKTSVVVARPPEQADYVTYGLLGEAPDVLAGAECEECDCEDGPE